MSDPTSNTQNQGKVFCHDGSPFVNIQCPDCAFIMHIHRTQLPSNYNDYQLRTFCKGCGAELCLPPITAWTGNKKVRLAKPKETEVEATLPTSADHRAN